MKNEPNLMIEPEDIWIKLGYLKVSSSQSNPGKVQNLYKIADELENQSSQPKYTLKLVIQCDPIYTYINKYKIRIIQSQKISDQLEKQNEIINKMELQNTQNFLQKSQVFQEIQMNYMFGATDFFLNYQDRQLLKFNNFVINKINQSNQQNLTKQQKHYCLQLFVEVHVKESMLITFTKNYEEYQRTGIQPDKVIKESRKAEGQNFQENQFIFIISHLVPKSGVRNLRETRTINLPNVVPNNQISEDSLKLYTKVNSSIQANSAVHKKIISLGQSCDEQEAGLYFDIDKNTKQAEAPLSFNGQLKPYQAKALTWMLFRQGQTENIGVDMTHQPYWRNKGSQLGLSERLLINEHLKFVVWKRNVEKICHGGILADQMGIGKTIMIIALILAHRPDKKCKTLIIAPLSVVSQWESQLNKFAPQLRVSANISKISENAIRLSDVVITTEGKLRADYNQRKSEADLISFEWFRVVIDEAHNFKNSSTQMAKAVYDLQAEYRWCLTGTPTQNSIGDIYSLVKFLKFSPWDDFQKWKSQFPKQKHTNSSRILSLKYILKGILLRRKKVSLDENGNKLLNLPQVVVRVHTVDMNEEARKIYNLIDYRANKQLESIQQLEKQIQKSQEDQDDQVNKLFLKKIKKIKMKKLLALLIKMRMICCHQFLNGYRTQYVSYDNFIVQYTNFLLKNCVKRKPIYNFFQYSLCTSQQKLQLQKQTNILSNAYPNWQRELRQLQMGVPKFCFLCELNQDCVVTPCMHIFCRPCIQQFLTKKWSQQIQNLDYYRMSLKEKNTFRKKNLKDFTSECPQCSDKLKFKEVFDLPRLNQFNRPLKQFYPNQKIIALLDYIKKMDPDDKALVFTSFLGMMTLICLSFEKNGISYLKIKGSASYNQRQKIKEQFNENKGIKVLIMTLKTGSVGLNMQVANKVFFMDPWWNPAVQEQAIGRVHRIGQTKQIEAIKFITNSSIQARIVKLSFLKKKVSDCILDIDDIINDKRYSSSRQQIRFLLSMDQTEQKGKEKNQQYQLKMFDQVNEEVKQILEIQNQEQMLDFSMFQSQDQSET